MLTSILTISSIHESYNLLHEVLIWLVIIESVGNLYVTLYSKIICVKSVASITFLAQNNSFPMREWHVEHMQKTIVKFATELSENASSWQRKQYKKYNNIANVCRNIDYDIKHGVTNEEVLSFIERVRNDSSYSYLQDNHDSMEKLVELRKYVLASNNKKNQRD